MPRPLAPFPVSRGRDVVEAIRYERHGEVEGLRVDGVFIFAGFLPNSNLFKVHVDHDADGYLTTDSSMHTSVEGLWAVGDVRAQLTRQITTAVGDGRTAAVAASAYVERRRDRRRQVTGGRAVELRADWAAGPAA